MSNLVGNILIQRWNLSMPSLPAAVWNFCQWCKILHFHSFFVFLWLKLLKLGEIDGVKFLAWKSAGVKFMTNSMSAIEWGLAWKMTKLAEVGKVLIDICLESRTIVLMARVQEIGGIRSLIMQIAAKFSDWKETWPECLCLSGALSPTIVGVRRVWSGSRYRI